MKKHLVFITVFAILTSLFSISAAADVIYDENGTAPPLRYSLLKTKMQFSVLQGSEKTVNFLIWQ